MHMRLVSVYAAASAACTRIFIGLIGALVVAGSLPAQQEPEPVVGAELHSLNRSLSIKDGARVVVVNPHGSVRIREIPLQATPEFRVALQTEAGVESPADLLVEPFEGGVRLAIEAAADGRLTREQGFLRADFVIGLPDRFALEVQMIDGSFTMHAASYPVKLRARSGSLNLRTTGALDVEIFQGHVVVQQGRGEAPIAGGRVQTSGAPVDVLGADLGRVNYETLSGAAVTTDSAAMLDARVQDGRRYRFVGDPDNPTLSIQTDAAPIRLVVEGIR